MRSRRFGAVFAALIAVMSGAIVGGGATANADPGCPNLYVVAVPGTWETSENPAPTASPGMLGAVTDGLPGDTLVQYVRYAATAFPWEGDVYGRSKGEAVNNARNMVNAMVQRCGNTKVALLGYSQGADAAGDLAAEIGTGLSLIRPERIVAVGLISDPRRSPTDALVGPPVGGAGAGGPRVGGFGFVSPVTRTICAIGDLYCSTASDDFVTRFSGFLAQNSDPNPANFWRYQQEGFAILGDLMAGGGIPLLQDQLNDQSNDLRRQQLEKFYRSGVHTSYGSYNVGGASALQWMHNYLAGAAR